MANTEPARKPPPKWARERLVACADGPYVDQWHTQEDWNARIEAARYMHEERGQRRSACLDYVRTGRTAQHPEEPTAIGDVLTYQPARRRS